MRRAPRLLAADSATLHRGVIGLPHCTLRPWSTPKLCGSRSNYDDANDAFRALVKAHPKNPDYRVRWGRLFLERFNPATPPTCFKEALEIKKDHAGALLGLALVAADGFESQGRRARRKGAEGRSEAGRSARAAGAPGARRQQSEKARSRKPTRRSQFRRKRWTPWPSSPPSTGWTTSPTRPWIGRILAHQSALRRGLRDRRRTSSSSTAATTKAFASTARLSSSSRICGARARSSAST